MEALVAFSLAANIAQFVNLSSKIFYGAKEVYQSSSGMTEESTQSVNVVRSMRRISLELEPPSVGDHTVEEQVLRQLASDCRVLADQLIEKIQSVMAKDPTSKRQAVYSVLKNAWTRKDRSELERRLGHCRSQLEMHLQLMTRYEIF